MWVSKTWVRQRYVTTTLKYVNHEGLFASQLSDRHTPGNLYGYGNGNQTYSILYSSFRSISISAWDSIDYWWDCHMSLTEGGTRIRVVMPDGALQWNKKWIMEIIEILFGCIRIYSYFQMQNNIMAFYSLGHLLYYKDFLINCWFKKLKQKEWNGIMTALRNVAAQNRRRWIWRWYQQRGCKRW